MLHRLVPALALAATAAGFAPTTLQAQGATAARPALRYHFTMTTGEESVTRGTVTVLGARARMDIEPGSSASVGDRKGASATMKSERGRDWFLLTDDGQRITIVDPDEKSYSEMDAASFTGLIGTVMRTLDTFMTMEVEKPTVQVQRMGDGGTIAGRPTERWAVVQEFTTNIGIMGKTTREMHRVVTDYWIAPGLALPDNPLFELVTRGEVALAQGNKDFVARVARARASLPRGASMRVVVTAASSELNDGVVKPAKVRRLDITDLQQTTVDPALLEVPRGYQRSDKKGMSIDL